MDAPRKIIKKRYRSVQAAIRDGWPDTLQKVDLSVRDYNLLGELAAQLFRVNPARDAEEIRAVSLNAFKNMCSVRKGKWVINTTYTLASGLQFQNPLAAQPNLEKVA